MSEDLDKTLENYKLQFRQVEAALLSDPSNDELIKLKADLEEVIRLTQELQSASGGSRRRDRERTATHASSASTPAPFSTSSSKQDTHQAAGDNLDLFTVTDAPEDEDFLNSILPGIPSGSSAPPPSAATTSSKPPPPSAPVAWKAGDQCYAPWKKDQKYYDATIEEVYHDGTCSVKFEGYDEIEICKILDIRVKDESCPGLALSAKKRKREEMAKVREAKKKKSEKKSNRMEELNTAQDSRKQSWVSFQNKMVRTGHADVFPKTAHARQSEASEEAEAEAQVAKSFTWGAGMRRAASIAAARHVAASTSAARQAKVASLHSALNG